MLCLYDISDSNSYTIAISPQKTITYRTIMISIHTSVYTIRQTDTWPASEKNYKTLW